MDEVRKLTEKGWCLRELAEKYGCSRQCMLDRMRKAGIPRLPAWSMPGARNPAWRGGRMIDGDGYVLIHSPNHPHATTAGYVREHRLVIEKKLGRYLKPSEVVHHKDGDRKNNRIGNLEVFGSNGDHLAATLKGKCPKWSADGKRRLREAAAKRRATCGKA